MKKSIISLIILILIAGCERDKIVISDLPVDIFTYQAFDTSGTQIVNGWFELDMDDSSQIKGSWHLQQTANVENIGPQIGDGNLSGNISANSININLNPDFIDNNIILQGTVSDYLIEGDWMWITIAGITYEGKFKLIRELTCLTEN